MTRVNQVPILKHLSGHNWSSDRFSIELGARMLRELGVCQRDTTSITESGRRDQVESKDGTIHLHLPV